MTEEPINIVAGRGHPLANKADLHLAELTSYRWIVPPRSEPDRLKLDALLINAGLPKPQIVCETTSLVLLTALLGRTHHLSYLTASNLYAPPELVDVVALAIREPTWTRTTCAVFRRKGIIRPTVLAFYNELERAYGLLKSQGGL